MTTTVNADTANRRAPELKQSTLTVVTCSKLGHQRTHVVSAGRQGGHEGRSYALFEEWCTEGVVCGAFVRVLVVQEVV